jgi:hypothetical protein
MVQIKFLKALEVTGRFIFFPWKVQPQGISR